MLFRSACRAAGEVGVVTLALTGYKDRDAKGNPLPAPQPCAKLVFDVEVYTLAGWRGADGTGQGAGAVNPNQLERYIENGCFWHHELTPDQRYFKHANAGYLAFAKSVGFVGSTDPIVLQLYVEPLQKFRLAAQGHGPIQPPDRLRARVEKFFDPLPIWYPPFEHLDAEEIGRAHV